VRVSTDIRIDNSSSVVEAVQPKRGSGVLYLLVVNVVATCMDRVLMPLLADFLWSGAVV
jgi:hypothetical protein